MKRPTEEQFTGCLIGQCLGDALGFMVEGEPPEVCQRFVNETMQAGRLPDVTRGEFAFGQYSDDSQMARELLQSFVEVGRFDPVDYARRIRDLFSEGRVVGGGQATAAAAERLAQGVPWQEAGTPPPAAGNGSAMRAAPIGLIYCHKPEQMLEAAHQQSFITHQDKRCSAGSIAIAGAVAQAAQTESINASAFSKQVADWTRPFDTILADSLERMAEWLEMPPRTAVGVIRRVGVRADYKETWPGISPFVTTSVLWTLYSFLRQPDDYWTAIGTAIAVGGDVDTTAAMTGAISGAHLGLSKIPPYLTRRLNDRGRWGYAELVELARRARTIASSE
jgi:ADP-ribosylglycohydrolase